MSESTTGAWVLDPAGSSATFASKTYWGLSTVRGTFGALSGNGTAAEDGTFSGELTIDATALNTKNKQRDTHLRSADFFDTEKHPSVNVTISSAKQSGSGFEGTGTIEAAGKSQPITFAGHVDSVSPEAVVLTGEATVDHRTLGMTWNRMGMIAGTSKATVTARFVRG